MSARLNVLDHSMVPRHLIMGEEEVATLLSRYNITNDQLPKMYHDDPAAKTVEAKPGDVILITRTSQTAGKAESFRLVIRRPKK